jgi:hypothetical protein
MQQAPIIAACEVPYLEAGGVSPAVFRNGAVINGATSATAVPLTGAVAGDLAMICVWNGAPGASSITGGSGGAWTQSLLTWTNFGYSSSVWQRVLTAGDLAGVTANTSSSGYTLAWAVYSNTTLATQKSQNLGDVGTTLPLVGFVKNVASKGVITFAMDRDPASVPTVPAGFTGRAGPGGFGTFSNSVADLLGGYVDNAAVTWTNFTAGLDQVGWLFEFT